MNKVKSILTFILGLIASILLLVAILLVIIRSTIYNKEYILNIINESNYYKNLTESIEKDMKNNLLSLELDESVIKDLFDKSDIQKETINLINSLYIGQKYKVNVVSIKEKIKQNINHYFDEKNIYIEDKETLEAIIDSITKVYKEKLEIYGYLDTISNIFIKIGNNIDIYILLTILAYIAIIIIIKYIIKNNILGSTFTAAGFMLLFIKYYIYEKIDAKNILIISTEFSTLIRKILENIGEKILLYSYISIIIGILIMIIESFKKLKRRTR